jgi:hypothetical protein
MSYTLRTAIDDLDAALTDVGSDALSEKIDRACDFLEATDAPPELYTLADAVTDAGLAYNALASSESYANNPAPAECAERAQRFLFTLRRQQLEGAQVDDLIREEAHSVDPLTDPEDVERAAMAVWSALHTATRHDGKVDDIATIHGLAWRVLEACHPGGESSILRAVSLSDIDDAIADARGFPYAGSQGESEAGVRVLGFLIRLRERVQATHPERSINTSDRGSTPGAPERV